MHAVCNLKVTLPGLDALHPCRIMEGQDCFGYLVYKGRCDSGRNRNQLVVGLQQQGKAAELAIQFCRSLMEHIKTIGHKVCSHQIPT